VQQGLITAQRWEAIPTASRPAVASRGLGGFSAVRPQCAGATSRCDAATQWVFILGSGDTGLLLVPGLAASGHA